MGLVLLKAGAQHMNFIENESPQKLRGGYYTHLDIATFLARWVLASNPKRILEPSCGDGVFFAAIATLGPKHLRELYGCELDEVEAFKAKNRPVPRATVSVHVGDFLQLAIERRAAAPDVDGVLGNPPFIRYQYLNAEQQDRARLLFEHYGLAFTKHTNAWVPFVLASIARLRPGGRLAMVLPAELLHVLHAQSLRSHLLASCSRILVIDPETLLFDGTLQGVVLLLAEKSAGGAAPGSLAITKFKGRMSLDDDPCSMFDGANFIDGTSVSRKWMPALLSKSERGVIERLSATPHVKRFAQLADVDVGIITGANKFFLVPDDVVDMYDLKDFAHPMFGRSDHVRGVIYDDSRHAENRRAGLPANFLWFGTTEKGELSHGARKYIESGETEGLHKRFKCRIRKPWYDVPSVHVSPIGMLKRSHNFPRMILNRARAFTTDTAYRIRPTIDVKPEQLVCSFVNSLTVLSAELEGRSYGGGVLELVPSEIERLLIPWDAGVPCELEALDHDVCAMRRPEDVLAAQDRRVLQRMGVRPCDAEELRGAWLRLKGRRQRNTGEGETEPEAQEDALPLVRKTRVHSTTIKKGAVAPGGGL